MSKSNERAMTGDQAVLLRQLVRAAKEAESSNASSGAAVLNPDDYLARRGTMTVMAGAKGGVGVTTLALRLAEAMADDAKSTILIDANLRQADLAHVAGAADQSGKDLADVLAGACTTKQALAHLTRDLWLLPGVWAPSSQPDATTESIRRWLEELETELAAGRNIVIDAGAGMKPWTEPLWRRAANVVLVTTPHKVSVLDAYAVTKLARSERVATPIDLLVNRVDNHVLAQDVHRRVSQTCQRFLGESVGLFGWAPDSQVLGDCGLSRLALRFSQPWVTEAERRHAA